MDKIEVSQQTLTYDEIYYQLEFNVANNIKHLDANAISSNAFVFEAKTAYITDQLAPIRKDIFYVTCKRTRKIVRTRYAVN